MSRLAFATLLAAGFVANIASAAEPQVALAGVWRGTVGTQAVMACFDSSDSGAYYYIKHRHSIDLRSDDKGIVWSETSRSGPAPTWSNWREDAGALAADWKPAGGGKPIAIRLKRAGKLPPDAHCYGHEVPEFDAPRLAATTVSKSESRGSTVHEQLRTGVAERPGPPVRWLTAIGDEITVLQLEATDAGAIRINEQLRAEFDGWMANTYECVGHDDGPGEWYANATDFAFLDADWLSLRITINWDCSGPYPGASIQVGTFDRHTGERVEPRSWIGDDDGVPEALAAIIEASEFSQSNMTTAEDREWAADCRESWAMARWHDVWPTTAGLAFSPDLPHVVQACGDDVVVPWSQLQPFLTAAGRAALSKRTTP